MLAVFARPSLNLRFRTAAGWGWLVWILALLASAAAHADPVDDYVHAQMVRYRVPGIAIAVMHHGQLVRAQGYGIANLEHAVPVHPDTLFKSGALGMQFTAIAAMLLVEDGTLRLDASVRTYLPAAPRSWAPITIRQLLNHSSGLPATPNGDFRTDYSDDALLAILYGQALNFPAGTRWRFSYVDYVVLGFIIRKATGEGYADLLARRVFGPLGMRTAQPIDERAVIPNRAAGYELAGGIPRNAEWVSPTANSTADGTLYLSVLDLAAWEAGLSRHALLLPESWAAIGARATLPGGRVLPYGFGWNLDRRAGQDVWWHSGSWQGFRTSITRYLGVGWTVVVLANGDSADPDRIGRHLAGLLDPALAEPDAAPLAEQDAADNAAAAALLTRIANGSPDFAGFAFFSKLDFTEGMAEYRRLVEQMGSVQAVAAFARTREGGEDAIRYRARYAEGVLELRIVRTAGGKIADLDLMPVESWTAPL